jgi:tetratricopeptide (TPR) repeat protein
MKTMKNTLYTTLLLLATTFIGLSQNVDFKAANFKDDKDGLKKATDAIKKGDEFYAIANEAIFQVQSPGLNYALALQEYMVAQKFNPNNAQLNFKIGVCHANSTDPFKSIEYISKAISLDPNCDPFLNYYKGYSLQLQGKFDEAVSAYTDFETQLQKGGQLLKICHTAKKPM